MSSKKTSKSKLKEIQEVVERPLQNIEYASSSSSSQPNCVGTFCFKSRRKPKIKPSMPPQDCDITLYIKNSKGKWIRNKNCLDRNILYNTVNKDRNVYKNDNKHLLPESIYSNWISNDETSLNNTGSNGNVGHKLFIKLPLYNIYITLNSYFKVQRTIDTKEWYALPILNGNQIRIGNIFGIQDDNVSILHGQKPGVPIYKLYTKDEIAHGIDEVIEDTNEYDTPLVTIRPALWDQLLYSVDERKNWQTNQMISKIIKSILFVVPNSNRKCKFMTMEEWGNPLRQDLLLEDVTLRDLLKYYEIIYIELYKLFNLLNETYHIAMDSFMNILAFIYNYHGKANNVELYTNLNDVKAFVTIASYIIINDDTFLNMEIINMIIKQTYPDYSDTRIQEIYNKLKEYYNDSQYNTYSNLYQILYECPHILSKSAMNELLRKQRGKQSVLEGTILNRIRDPYFHRLTPAQQSRYMIMYILQKSQSIFKEDIEEIPEQYIMPQFSYVTSYIPNPPRIILPDRTRYTLKPLTFW